MSIATRISLGFSAILLLTVSVAAVGWNGLDTYAGRVDVASRTATLDSKLNLARLEEARYLIDIDPSASRRVRFLTDSLKADAEALLNDPAHPVNPVILGEALEKLTVYRKAFDEVVRLEVEKFASLSKLRKQTAVLLVAAQSISHAQADRYSNAVIRLHTDPMDGDAMATLESSVVMSSIANRMIQETRGAMLDIQQFLIEGGGSGRDSLNASIDKLLYVVADAKKSAPDSSTQADIANLTAAVLGVETEFLLVRDIIQQRTKARAAMKSAADAVSERVDTLVAGQLAEREAGRNRAVALLWTGALGALAVGVLLSILIARSLSNPITATTRAIQRLAEGDLTVTIPGTGRQDELGAIGRAISSVIQVLHGLHREMHRLSGMTTGSRSTADTANDRPVAFHGAYGEMVDLLKQTGAAFQSIGDQATQVAIAAGQASTAVAQVSDGASEQTGDLDQVVIAVGQSARAIAHVTDSTRDVSDMVKDAAGFADKGKQDMARLLSVSQTIAENSRRIGRITEAITQIAVKTNILSVNASIEAARAGEQGKGFEVVAEEVGKLADSAVDSARQIADIIETAAAMAAEGTAVTEQARRMMDGLAERVARIDQAFQAVAVAMEQQQASVKDIEGSVESVRMVASKNAAASEEIAATMVQLSRLADDTRRQAERFKAL
ncbi:methyl-accepting chemotaxis protein [Azospirillum griseum]|uniref:Methyl-accepting chemotaxis protein n=1 Tax=Azospirillum griseum TaxID=2496639 RepID=A0A3S0HYD7_9PROT|nr:HAMP domain-containing methyl-accepting chemotaxis protein [Azospirillum griseum]RTR21431.1 methyl-accepting chemotaxis protein [Azospirillum griseum]